MRIKWYGHASFLIQTSGKNIITDPYVPGAFGALRYGPIPDNCHIALVSHDHDDHNGVSSLKGSPKVFNSPGTYQVDGIKIKGIHTYHDSSKGKERGENIVFVVESEGIKVCHLGDLGHVLSDAEVKEIGQVDVLLIPVGGTYTIGPEEARRVVDLLKPRVVIPMHYKTPKCGFPLKSVDDFIKGIDRVKRIKGSEVEIESGKLPSPTEIWILEYAM